MKLETIIVVLLLITSLIIVFVVDFQERVDKKIEKKQIFSVSTNKMLRYIIKNKSSILICTWKQCKKGAVSISIDDGFTTCMDELEKNNYRGTYFLSNTKEYSREDWMKFNMAFKKGHEIGTHRISLVYSQTK